MNGRQDDKRTKNFILVYEAVLGGGPGFDLGPKNVYFWGTYFKDQDTDTQIFGLVTKMWINTRHNFYVFCVFYYGT